MFSFSIKPGDKLIKSYYDVLGGLGQLHFDHEGAVRIAFHDVLSGYGRKLHWTLVDEYPMKGRAGRIEIDGALLDEWKQRHGFWEAKDEHDDLVREIKHKIELGYPTNNTIFQAPERAILYQHGVRQGLSEDIRDSKNLVELLKEFFAYREPEHEEWDAAVAEFKERIPELAAKAKEIIDAEHKSSRAFRDSFEAFYALCRQAINPNLSKDAVEEMLIQHLLTERIFRRVFHAEEFRSRNVIAAEIEKVITSMTSRHFSRDQFLSDLDRFYKVLERAADDKDDYSEKQAFLNTVYERFFQGYSPKEADTHGIVYTPQPIVDFMVRSVEDILKKEFGRSLADRNVHILDPFVGTGNFIVRVMRQIAETDKGALPYKYEHELHCNEVMLLPYYIASMNIEHEYLAQTGEYRPFDGICLVDTFELAEPEQGGLEFMTEENTERVKRQKEAPIFVIIGNPPYNAWQVDENDNNKNRKYAHLDRRVADTFVHDSSATLTSSLNDPYIRALRWATDRIGTDGIVTFVSNSGFLDSRAADGVRAHLQRDYTDIFVLDLGGNVRRNPKLSGTTHNVFGIQVGVSINLLIRNSTVTMRPANVWYAAVGKTWRKEHKYDYLNQVASRAGIQWETIPHGAKSWIPDPAASEFSRFSSLGGTPHAEMLFASNYVGTSSQRDAIVYGFDLQSLKERCEAFVVKYNAQVFAYAAAKSHPPIDDFPTDPSIKWSQTLKCKLAAGTTGEYRDTFIVSASYRPFTKVWLYYDPLIVDRPGGFDNVFRGGKPDNVAVALTGPGSERPFMALAVTDVPDSHFVSPGCTTQCFPFYTYSEDGSNRSENITDWALDQFRSHYHDPSITKWDIFHYVYAVLHHPEYRSRYAANLKRELPRIPFLGAPAAEDSLKGHGFSRAEQGPQDCAALAAAVKAPGFSPVNEDAKKRRASALVEHAGAKAPTTSSAKSAGLKPGASTATRSDKDIFWKFVAAGKRLAQTHVHYEQQPEYPLEKIWKPGAKLDYRVTKMRLSKDKSTLFYNDALTLKGIPKETYDYRLGNRSALEWVVDQYQVSTDKRSGITNDPNRPEAPQYILRLVGAGDYGQPGNGSNCERVAGVHHCRFGGGGWGVSVSSC
jgi:predicted helicase